MYRTIKKILTALLFFTLSLTAQWLQTGGPYGATIYSLTASGTTIVAATLSGIYRTTNDGVSWSQSSGIPASSYVVSVTPAGAGLYAGTSSGPYVSMDKGVTWSPLDSAGAVGYVTAALVKDSMIFAGTFGGLYASSTNGKYWGSKDTVIAQRQVNALFAFGPYLFAGTGNGLFRSTDNGSHWKNADSLVNTAAITSFLAKGTNLFASSYTGVFVSADSGKKWTRVKGTNIQQIVMCLATDGMNIIAGTTQEGVLHSANNGDTWTKLGMLPSSHVNGVTFRGTNIFAGHSWGVSISSNGGTTWSDMNTGITGTNVISVTRANGELIAVTGTSGMFTSINNGLTWNPNPNSVKNSIVYSFFADTTAFRLGTNTGIMHSADAGLSWSPDTAGLGLNHVAGTFVRHGSLFCGSIKGVFEHNGTKWTARNSGLPKNPYVKALYSFGGALFAAVNDSGIFRSSDKGITWSFAGKGIPPSVQMSAFISVGATLYLGATSGVFATTDLGTNWKKISAGLPVSGASAFATVNGSLFAGTIGSGVFLLNKKESVWNPVSTGIPTANVYTLHAENNALYAGTISGIWKRPLNEMITSVAGNDGNAPMDFQLSQNFPNPFNPSTTIGFTLPVSGVTTLRVFDALGREIAALVNEHLEAGAYHQRTFDASRLSSGVYFYTLTSGSVSQTRRMLLLK